MPVVCVLTAIGFLINRAEGRRSYNVSIPTFRSGLFMPVVWVLAAIGFLINRAEGRRSYNVSIPTCRRFS
jgi:hypothetical protein